MWRRKLFVTGRKGAPVRRRAKRFGRCQWCKKKKKTISFGSAQGKRGKQEGGSHP